MWWWCLQRATRRVAPLLLFLTTATQSFVFDECRGGTDEFAQTITERLERVGRIPVGTNGVEVKLRSVYDLDIQLYEVSDDDDDDDGIGIPIIRLKKTNTTTTNDTDHLPILGNSPNKTCAVYKNTTYCYSGYDGTNNAPGNEWITIANSTNVELDLYVWSDSFGNEAASMIVTYTWDGAGNCPNGSGSGSFEQTLSVNTAVTVGTIRSDLRSVQIFLESDTDIDIQLYDVTTTNGTTTTTPIVKWNPLLNDAWVGGLLGHPPGTQEASVVYKNRRITYSGYNGYDPHNPGNEYISITMIDTDDPEVDTTMEFVMKVYSFQAGTAIVSYAWDTTTDSSSAIQLEQVDYVSTMASPFVYNVLSRRDDVPGALDVREVKFILTGLQTNEPPTLYFFNTKKHQLHFDFTVNALGWELDVQSFQEITYFSPQRTNMVGSIVYHPNFVDSSTTSDESTAAATGIYTLEFWPLDPVSTDLVVRAYSLIAEQITFATASNQVFRYHPAGENQLQLYKDDSDAFDAANIPVIVTDELFGNVQYVGLNVGTGVGILRVVQQGDASITPSIRDVVIFTYVPPDLTHVAGIITESPQTPLSHINLKAKQNDTPNSYIANASTDPKIAPLLNTVVTYTVSVDGYSIVPATQEEADAWLESVRPDAELIPQSDLGNSSILPQRLADLSHADWLRVGSKAANVAELGILFGSNNSSDSNSTSSVHVPDGYAIPFTMYDEFMDAQRCGDTLLEICSNSAAATSASLYDQAREMMNATEFWTNATSRSDALKVFRNQIENSNATVLATQVLEDIRTFWDLTGPPYNTSIRCRSSTNNEDLESFNGAGLYVSKTHKPSEGDLIDTVKQIWAGLWTQRSVDERNFYRIDHFRTYMGVLLHSSYGDEQANGVGVTKNIYYQGAEGYYMNVQYGEISVTNPEAKDAPDGALHAVPDEILISRLVGASFQYEWETQYIRHSNVDIIYKDQPENVLTEDELVQVRSAMQAIQEHFRAIYDGDASFAMDIEFKITYTTEYDPEMGVPPLRGYLSIKQARPWV